MKRFLAILRDLLGGAINPAPHNPAPPPRPHLEPQSPGERRRRVFELQDEYRRDAGLRLLPIDATLLAAAQGHASWMARTGKLQHTGPLGATLGDRLDELGWHASSGENLARGGTPEETVADWLNSSGHSENLLSREWTRCGIGYAEDAQGVPYWCAVYG